MKTKPILRPERLRHVPRQFSWIDQRLVRDRHIHGRSPEALALYLFLCTVADAQGASYYSDTTTGKTLTFSSTRLRDARTELIAAGLIVCTTLTLLPLFGRSRAERDAELEPDPVPSEELS